MSKELHERTCPMSQSHTVPNAQVDVTLKCACKRDPDERRMDAKELEAEIAEHTNVALKGVANLRKELAIEKAAREKAEASWREAILGIIDLEDRAVRAEVHAKTLQLQLSKAAAHERELDEMLGKIRSIGDTPHERRLNAIALLMSYDESYSDVCSERDALKARVELDKLDYAELEKMRDNLTAKLNMAREDNALLEKRIALAEQVKDALAKDNAELRAAIATPEIYTGVVSKALAREREEALEKVRVLRKFVHWIKERGYHLFEHEETFARMLRGVDHVLGKTKQSVGTSAMNCNRCGHSPCDCEEYMK